MANIDRFYIGQLEGKGLRTNLKPFAIPDDAFAQLTNAYLFRGRIKKRFGSQLMMSTGTIPYQYQSRLKVLLGTSSGTTFSATIAMPSTNGGQAFSVGNEFFTYQGGAISNTLLSIDAGAGTYDGSTGALSLNSLTASTGTNVYWYPALPVMGLVTYIPVSNTPNVTQTIAFDTKYWYTFGVDGWVCTIDSPFNPLWTGTNLNFFWGCNGFGADPVSGNATLQVLYVTNYNLQTGGTGGDPMYYLNSSGIWTPFQPQIGDDSTFYVSTCLMIISFKNRILLLNVQENAGGVNTTYINRIRYSWFEDNIANSSSAFQRQDGLGGYLDIPTNEAIVTAQFIKDRLIIFCEQSTWELVFTGNQIVPFVVQQINTELGAQSLLSEVPFDKVVLGVGNTGIHACNGSNVTRIDEDIPDIVFEIHDDNNSVQRVAGIRDYYSEMVYWTFPTSNRLSTFPYCNRVLTYNYKVQAWAFNQDSFTVWGYFQTALNNTSSSLTWSQTTTTWDQTGYTWASPVIQGKFQSIIGGNQEGFVLTIEPDEIYSNAPSLQVTGMTITYIQPDPNATQYIVTITCQVIDHNLDYNTYIRLDNAWITTTIAPTPALSNLNTTTFMVQFDPTTPNQVIAVSQPLSFIPNGTTYLGGGTLALVTPIDILTKQYNFYATNARNVAISQLDCLVDRTDEGEVSIDVLLSSSPNGIMQDSETATVIPGNSILSTAPYDLMPSEQFQDRLWHPTYLWSVGDYVQFHFYLNPVQTCTNSIADADFQLHAMIIYATSSGRLQ